MTFSQTQDFIKYTQKKNLKVHYTQKFKKNMEQP